MWFDGMVPASLAALGYDHGDTSFTRINQQDARIVDQQKPKIFSAPRKLSLLALFGHSFPSKKPTRPGEVAFDAGKERKGPRGGGRQSGVSELPTG